MYSILKKLAQNVSYEELLQNSSKHDGTRNKGDKASNKQMEPLHRDEELNVSTEKQMEEVRQNAEEGTIEAQMDSSKSKLVKHRSDKNEGRPVKPLDLLNQAQHEKLDKELKKEATDRDTMFWDFYTGGINDAPSQLQNAPSRFGGLSLDSSDLVDKATVKKMAMSSLKDADAILFHIYAQAADQNRDLDAEDKALIEGITNDKNIILAQCGAISGEAHMISNKIKNVKDLIDKTSPSDPEFDLLQDEYHKLLEAGKNLN